MPDREWWAREWDRSEYDRRRYEAAKEHLIELLGGHCNQCQSTEDLQFDHVSRELKKFAITKRWNRDQSELAAELAKCQLLCGICHKNKTRGEIRNQHGGGLTGIRQCKCRPCLDRRAARARELKALKT